MPRHPSEHLDDADVRLVLELARTPLEIRAFRDVWDRFGASWDRGTSDAYGFTVALRRSALWVDPLGARVISARLPTWYLVDDEVGRTSNDRADFDAAYDWLRDRVRAVRGAPSLVWQDTDEAGYRAEVWEGAHGILVAQQAAIDSEFGDEVCLAVEGVRLADLVPSTPLVDAFVRRSKKLHEAHGFPRVEV